MSPNTTEHHQSLRECPSRPLWLPLSPRQDLHRDSSSHHGCSRRRPSETSNRHRRRQEAKASYCIITFRKFHGMSHESRGYIVIGRKGSAILQRKRRIQEFITCKQVASKICKMALASNREARVVAGPK